MILGSLIYCNSLNNQFVFDDLPLIRDNPSIKNLAQVPSYLFAGIDNAPYRPLRWISYAIDYQLSGLNPLAYHISNILFHLLTTIIVYATIAAMTGSARTAFFAACLFAVHPVHTDSVTYISGRRDILSTLFYLLGFNFFVRSRRNHRTGLLAPALACYLLAIASKEMAVTLPAIFFFYDLIRNLPREGSLFRRCSAALGKIVAGYKLFYLFFLSTAILFTCYKVLIKSPSNKVGLYGGDMYIQMLTVGKILVYYIKQLLLPVTLIADYSFNSFPLATHFYEPATLVSLVALCLLLIITMKLLAGNSIMAFAVIWFFVTLLPVSHIFPHHELLAEHYLYLPSFGFVLLMAILLDRASSPLRLHYYTYGLFTVIVVLFSLRTFDRNYDWKDSFTLWSKTVKTVPHCVRALNNLGIEYYNRKDYSTAKRLYQEAIQLQPAYEKAYYNLGNVYKEEHDYERALTMYAKVAELNPKNVMNSNNLGNAYAMKKRYQEAIASYQLALQHQPDYAEAYNNLGNVYRSLKNPVVAVTHYQKALSLNPHYADARNNLAGAYGDLKDYDQAIEILDMFMGKNPYDPVTATRLGGMYEKKGDYEKSEEYYRYALKLKPTLPEARYSLARVLMATLQYQQALENYQQALEIAPSNAEAHLGLAFLYLEKLKDKKKALHHLKLALEKAPGHPQGESIKATIGRLEKEGAG